MKKMLVCSIMLMFLCTSSWAGSVAHWKMNDDAATNVVLDSAGDHNGVLTDAGGTATTAAHTATGQVNAALEFDGTDDHIIVGDSADFSPALSAFSISVWIEMDSSASFEIINKWYSNKEEWALRTDPSGYLYFEVWDASEDAYIGRYYNTTLVLWEDTFIHIVATYDGSEFSDHCKIYLNGTQVDSNDYSSGSFTSVENTDQDVWIGIRNSTNADGVIDNLMIYDQELTSAQVLLLYNGGDGTENPDIITAASATPSSFRFRHFRRR